MISRDAIKEYLKAMATATSSTLVREDQDGPAPRTFPVLSYKIINANLGSSHQAAISQEAGTPDADGPTVDVTKSWGARQSVSITFRTNGNLPQVYNAVHAAFLWIRSRAAKEKAQEQGVVVKALSPAVEDRTAQIADLTFESRMGFDLRFDGRDVLTEQVEQLTTVSIDSQTEDDDPQEILVEEPE